MKFHFLLNYQLLFKIHYSAFHVSILTVRSVKEPTHLQVILFDKIKNVDRLLTPGVPVSEVAWVLMSTVCPAVPYRVLVQLRLGIVRHLED